MYFVSDYSLLCKEEKSNDRQSMYSSRACLQEIWKKVVIHDVSLDVRAVLANRYTFVKTYLPAIRVLWQEVSFHSEIKQCFQRVFTEHVYPKFARIVRHFQEKGELAELPVDSVIRLTITSLAGFLAARFLLLPDHHWDDEAEMERTIHVLMNGLRR